MYIINSKVDLALKILYENDDIYFCEVMHKDGSPVKPERDTQYRAMGKSLVEKHPHWTVEESLPDVTT